MLRKIASVGGWTLASRVLGFVRDMLTAQILGTGAVADAFFVAFRLPNNFRALFAEGAFNAAFVPMFAGKLAQEGREAARRFAEQILSVLLASQLILLVLFLAIMPWFMHLYAPGFASDPAKFALTVEFTRITFPYLLFVVLFSLNGAVLNSIGRFAAPAAAPILLNLCFIGALVWLTPVLPTAGHALAWGVLAAGAAQFLYLAFDSRLGGMSLGLPVIPRVTPEVRQFLRVLGPAALGAGVVQINLFMDTLIASLLPTGAVSYFYYADRLNQLPLGVIGIAIGTVLLPELSRRLKVGDAASALSIQNRALELSLLLTLPCAAAFLVAGEPIIRVLFQRGEFTALATEQSARALMAYALGLPAFVLLRSLLPGFHARGDTATPVKVAACAMIANVGLKLAMMGPLGVTGIALATSLSAWANVAGLGGLLVHRGLLSFDPRFRRALPRVLGITAAMAAVMIGVRYGLAEQLAAPGFMSQAPALAGVLGSGCLVFLVLAWPLGLLRRR